MPGHNVDCKSTKPNPNDRAPNSGDLKRLGEFVIALALDSALWSKVDTPAKAEQELKARGFVIPPGVTVVFERRKDMEFKILVPQADIAAAAICEARTTAKYDRLPPEYKTVDTLPSNKFEEFYELRVGDYCMGYCR